jgi:hypothetical protein
MRFQRRRRRTGGRTSPSVRLEFQIASKCFRAGSAGWLEFAALQRGWRDFRMAQSSFERADPRCQKIGRRRLSRCREGTVESFR